MFPKQSTWKRDLKLFQVYASLEFHIFWYSAIPRWSEAFEKLKNLQLWHYGNSTPLRATEQHNIYKFKEASAWNKLTKTVFKIYCVYILLEQSFLQMKTSFLLQTVNGTKDIDSYFYSVRNTYICFGLTIAMPFSKSLRQPCKSSI